MTYKFSPTIDRQKSMLLEIVNRGDGLTPLKFVYSAEADFEDTNTYSLRASIGEITNLNTVNIVNDQTIRTDTVISNLGQIKKIESNYIDNKFEITTNTLIAKSSANIANIEISENLIKTIDEEGALNINSNSITLEALNTNGSVTSKGAEITIEATNIEGDINITTANSLESTTISSGNVNITSYGTGDINLMPTETGPEGSTERGDINLSTVKITPAIELDITSGKHVMPMISPIEDSYLAIKGKGNLKGVIIEGIEIAERYFKGINNQPVEMHSPIEFRNNDDYVCFRPQSGVTQTYYWPEAPGIFGEKKERKKLDVYFYVLTSDSDGALSWEGWLSTQALGGTVKYLTSDSSGNLSFEEKDIPLPEPEPQNVEIKNHLTSDSSGNLSFTTSEIFIPPLPELKNKLIVGGKEYKFPSKPKIDS